jgi:tripeptide aminopeptidase
MKSLEAEIVVDNAAEKIEGNSGNLIVRLPGTISGPAIMFCAHMDTVEPGVNVKPVVKNGLFKSDGTTILGSDDKSGIAVLIECMRIIKENNIPHATIELIFTVGEEVGLLGAKNLQYENISAKYGYVLDVKDPNIIITHAPSAIRFIVTITGKDAHSGMEPEKGINSIHLAAKAIANLPVGRIDHETTLNVGLIDGGVATNIVPRTTRIKGEARSHDDNKLKGLTQNIIDTFESVVKTCPKFEDPDTKRILPDIDIQIHEDFQATHISDDHPVVQIASQAASLLNRSLNIAHSGGASDANIFCQNGIITGVLGTGMTDIHTVNESIQLDDMIRTVELIFTIIQIHYQKIKEASFHQTELGKPPANPE